MKKSLKKSIKQIIIASPLQSFSLKSKSLRKSSKSLKLKKTLVNKSIMNENSSNSLYKKSLEYNRSLKNLINKSTKISRESSIKSVKSSSKMTTKILPTGSNSKIMKSSKQLPLRVKSSDDKINIFKLKLNDSKLRSKTKNMKAMFLKSVRSHFQKTKTKLFRSGKKSAKKKNY